MNRLAVLAFLASVTLAHAEEAKPQAPSPEALAFRQQAGEAAERELELRARVIALTMQLAEERKRADAAEAALREARSAAGPKP